MRAPSLSPEERLSEWSVYVGSPPVNAYPDTSVLGRIIEEGPAAPAAGVRGNGPTLRTVAQQEHMMEIQQRVREVSMLIGMMPQEDWRQVVRVEWVDGKGYREARRQLGWHERKWLTTRATMLGWLQAKLDHFY